MADTLLKNNREFIEQIKKFIVSNNIVGYTAGVCVALGTKDVIESAVSSVIVPGIILALLMLDNKFLQAHLPKNATVNVNDLVKKFFTWLMLVVMTYVFVKIAFERLLGVTSKTTTVQMPQPQPQQQPQTTPSTSTSTPMHAYQGPSLEQQQVMHHDARSQPLPQQPQSVEPFYGAGRGSAL